MHFQLIPILEDMIAFYNLPRTPARFKIYLDKLQGETKDDMLLPIGHFNPMAKEHVNDKLNQLLDLRAEAVMQEALTEVNTQVPSMPDQTIEVVLNLADDLGGAWTNFYTTDFDSKFKLSALVSRNFCTPHFWSSEIFTEQVIQQRTLAYAYRTSYWIEHGALETLEDHLQQEIYVARKMNLPGANNMDVKDLEKIYETFRKEDDYSLIFNFFYGDQASRSLNYPSYGISETNGFDYACILADAKDKAIQ